MLAETSFSSFLETHGEELRLRIERAIAPENKRYRSAQGAITADFNQRGLSGTTAHWGRLLDEGLSHASHITKLVLDELFILLKAEKQQLNEAEIADVIVLARGQFKESAGNLVARLAVEAKERGLSHIWHPQAMQPRVNEAMRLSCDVDVPLRAADLRREQKSDRPKRIYLIDIMYALFSDFIACDIAHDRESQERAREQAEKDAQLSKSQKARLAYLRENRPRATTLLRLVRDPDYFRVWCTPNSEWPILERRDPQLHRHYWTGGDWMLYLGQVKDFANPDPNKHGEWRTDAKGNVYWRRGNPWKYFVPRVLERIGIEATEDDLQRVCTAKTFGGAETSDSVLVAFARLDANGITAELFEDLLCEFPNNDSVTELNKKSRNRFEGAWDNVSPAREAVAKEEAVSTPLVTSGSPSVEHTKDGLTSSVSDRSTKTGVDVAIIDSKSSYVYELSAREAEVLAVLCSKKAFDSLSKITIAEIAKFAQGCETRIENYKHPVSSLKKKGLVKTRGGRSGGCWLTNQGRQFQENGAHQIATK